MMYKKHICRVNMSDTSSGSPNKTKFFFWTSQNGDLTPRATLLMPFNDYLSKIGLNMYPVEATALTSKYLFPKGQWPTLQILFSKGRSLFESFFTVLGECSKSNHWAVRYITHHRFDFFLKIYICSHFQMLRWRSRPLHEKVFLKVSPIKLERTVFP